MTLSGVREARATLCVAVAALRCCIFAGLVALTGGCHRSDSTNVAPATPPPTDLWKKFSGDEAFAYTKAQVDFGPRPAGSATLAKTRGYIIGVLTQAGWEVEQQKFTDETPNGKIDFVNLIARFPKPASTTTQRAIVCSHYDTKLFSMINFLGADDGASSTGALMELARVLTLDPALAQQIELVFFDGEEAVRDWTETDSTYGSRHYAAQLWESKRAAQFEFGILWDMIGKKDSPPDDRFAITLPPDSPPELVKGIFSAANALNDRNSFTYFDKGPIGDDHVPLNRIARIPTIDLIGFNFMPWHTADDTLDKLSPESLQIVGAVTLYYLQEKLEK